MNQPIFRSKSIAELHQGMGLENPKHPLITVIDTANLEYGEEYVGARFTTDLYCISLKDNGCGIDYGKNAYDFNVGVLLFMAPEQVFTVLKTQKRNEVNGWMLYFHPDLIRNTHLGKIIDRYTFFNYQIHEALHLSLEEQNTLNQLVDLIQNEINQRIDNHSQQVLVSHIQLLLDHCVRFYERQMNTRSAQNHDVIIQVEKLLKEHFANNNWIETGQPTIEFLADKCNLSPHYLSDVLKKVTGKTAKDHINDFIIEKSKFLLKSTSDTVSGIAYNLGFNYPHYFARLFKQKTGKTPQEYRKLA
jgi:AraC-like DNA-binding protein